MSYTKIIQYGDITEVYNYQKSLNNTRRKPLTKIQKKRQQARRKSTNHRTKYSVDRAKKNLFRLVYANNAKAKSIHFVTLTVTHDVKYQTFLKYLRNFNEKLKKFDYGMEDTQISYIGVPERTKKGVLHYHLLFYNLSPEKCRNERQTRNIQRQCWQRGYLQIDFATYVTAGLAGYMAKYMGKFLGSKDSEAVRAYTCSRNVEKIRSYGSNTLSEYSSLIAGSSNVIDHKNYKVPFLGDCNLYKHKL